ncbi:MAG: ABC transporter ATP-binding protein [Myxococcaceae bacterium]
MSAPVDDVLIIEGLSKRYGAITALEAVDLRIHAGEIFALLGPNGAGKTTLIGAVCGTVRKTEGRIRVLGTDLDQDAYTPRFGIGLVPQEVNFDPFFTPAEALRLQQGYMGQRPDEARVQEVLGALKLLDKQDASTRALSGGMKRRLLIAKALVHRPKLLFLDEPTAGVDIELRRDLWAYVRRLRNEGMTIVLTTHYLEEAEELADRVGVIDHGRLLLTEEKRSLMRRLGETQLEVTLAEPAGPLSSAIESEVVWDNTRTKLSYTERPDRLPAVEMLRLLYAQPLHMREVTTRHSRLEDVLLNVLRSTPKPAAAAP